jgi:hypothetical protein
MFASEKMWKVPEQTLELLAARGAVIILADNAANEVRSQVPAYRAASRVLRASIAFDAENEPIEILDPVHNSKEGSDRQVVCDPTEMVVAPWLSPVYQGVRELFAGNPVVLKSWLHALASGHRRTAEITVTRFGPQLSFAEKRVPPFASIAQIGNGYLAFIAAHTSHDWMLDHYPDNLRWHLNLIRFLRGESQRSRRQQEGTGIVFLSHQLLVTAPIDAARALLDLPR